MGVITRDTCPVCEATGIAKRLEAKDYTVSQQSFEIWQCGNCLVRFTQGVPDVLSAGAFYQSDAYISHTDTDKGVINKLYHLVRTSTLKRKLKLIERASGVRQGNLLDIGAGTGAFVNIAQQAGWQVKGLEPDAGTRERAARLHGVQLEDTTSLFQLPPEHFDAITLWHVLEHVHELHAYIEQIKWLLKKDGRALIAVPNYTSYDAGAYQQYWAAYDVPRHLYHFSPEAIKQLLKLHGLGLVGIKRMWYDSFYISMLSQQYKTGKNNYIKAVWQGLASDIAAFFKRERCSSLIYIIGK